MYVAAPPPPLGHPNVIPRSAPVHATLAQPAAGADALKDFILRTLSLYSLYWESLHAVWCAIATRKFCECSSLWASESLRECLPKSAVEVTTQNFLHACNARSLSQDPVPT
jgi:hypothetical protein